MQRYESLRGLENLFPLTIIRQREMERAGVPQITTQGLRHTAVTITLRSGTSAVIVSQKNGHLSITTTADIYDNVMPSDPTQANSAVKAFLVRGNATSEGDVENAV